MGLFYEQRNKAQGCRTVTGCAKGDQRFQRHKALTPKPKQRNGGLKPLLSLMIHRLPSLIRSRSGLTHWRVTAIKSPGNKKKGAKRETVIRCIHTLHKHTVIKTRNGNIRQRRDQALHSAYILLCYFIERVNIDPWNSYLSWLEVERGGFERIAGSTGLSISAVRDAHLLLQEAGFLRVERQRERSPKGWRELPARRWLTPHLFAALGLGKQYKKALAGENLTRPQPSTALKTRPAPKPWRGKSYYKTPAAKDGLNALFDILTKPPPS